MNSVGIRVSGDIDACLRFEALKYFLASLLVAVSFNAVRADEIGSVLDSAIRQQSIPGISAVVIRDHHVLFSGGRGVADIESGQPMDDRTVMYVGSLSKILTAVLALRQVEGGALALEETLDRQPAITLLHLLTHQSGFPMDGDFGYWFSGEFPDQMALADYIDRAPLGFQPGTRVRYSNIGYAALGSYIADRANQDFETLLRTRVLKPLGMNDTGARGPAAGVASAYTPPGRLIPDRDRPFAGVGEKIAGRHVRMYHDAGAMSPAFGAYSTASDMGRLLLFLLGRSGEDVLSTEMRARMYESVASNRGLGLRLESIDGRPVARHGGWFAAYRSHLMLEPSRGIGIVVLTNSDSAKPASIADDLYYAIAR